MKQLTVLALIGKLKKLPGDRLVELEGCDCIGPCIGISDDNESVTLMRGQPYFDDNDFLIPGEFIPQYGSEVDE